MKNRFAEVVFVAAVLFVSAAAAIVVRAQSKPKWTSTICAVNSCIADALNRLTPERAAEAKLTTWGNLTYVWFRE